MDAIETRKRTSDDNDQTGQRKRRKSDQKSAASNSGKQPAASTSKTTSDVGRLNGNTPNQKKNKLDNKHASSATVASTSVTAKRQAAKIQPRNFRKLNPARPFPTVAPSVSATGPRSLHHEGKNLICVTRRTNLGNYLSRCKDVIMKDGYKSLQLHALGAAIPHLLMLAVSLPIILPFPRDQIHTDVETGTVNVHDEIFPTNEEEDFSLRTRSKSTLIVRIKIGDGVDDRPVPSAQSNSVGAIKRGKRRRGGSGAAKVKAAASAEKGNGKAVVDTNQIAPEQIIVREIDQDSDSDDGDADAMELAADD